ncbi:MAG: T9SS type A sorting domain-containing protein [Calditrichaeota bacterium]|nr:T9SS type A sorting domain-containing protein [Calditrichota bacterium]
MYLLTSCRKINFFLRKGIQNQFLILIIVFLIFISPIKTFPQQWELIGLEGEVINTIAIHPVDESIIYVGSTSDFSAGTWGKVFKSTDYGNSWDTLLTNVSVGHISFHQKKPRIIYIALGTANATIPGILKSVDNGNTWARADSGITLNWETGVGTVVPHPDSIDVVYAGAVGIFGAPLYKSINGGESWVRYEYEDVCCNFDEIVFDPINPSIIYVANEKLYRSENSGKSWNVVENWECCGGSIELVIDFTNNNVIYSAVPLHRILKSIDFGNTWFYSDSGIVRNNYHELIINPSNNKELFTVTGEGVLSSTNAAEDWQVLNSGFPENTYYRTITISPSASTLYCGTDSGLYKLSLVTSLERTSPIQEKSGFKLFPNYPNPFNAETIISFELPIQEFVQIFVYDLLGEQIFRTSKLLFNKGYNEKIINLKDMATGLYVYELRTNRNILRKKLLLIK